ncbi:hypothetical protein FRX31_020386 [Thalictrum thalictroides]|uniref:Uncharacterized protein n=1 Tax=Thalictrum thalictroides TaxID=46969 RepID=A0A7J6VZ99_THATH|nr:hypothetical protein FRX31_020386 [Thalictrum thalictroides]
MPKVLNEGVSIESKTIQFNGETLPENLTLAECLVDDGSELFVADRAEIVFKNNEPNVTNDFHEVNENLSRQDQDEVKHDSRFNLLLTTSKDRQRKDVHGKSDVPEDIRRQDKTDKSMSAAEGPRAKISFKLRRKHCVLHHAGVKDLRQNNVFSSARETSVPAAVRAAEPAYNLALAIYFYPLSNLFS